MEWLCTVGYILGSVDPRVWTVNHDDQEVMISRLCYTTLYVAYIIIIIPEDSLIELCHSNLFLKITVILLNSYNYLHRTVTIKSPQKYYYYIY